MLSKCPALPPTLLHQAALLPSRDNTTSLLPAQHAHVVASSSVGHELALFSKKNAKAVKKTSLKAACGDTLATSTKAVKPGKKGKKCFLSQVKEEEKDNKGKSFHQDSLENYEELRAGIPVRFYKKLLIVKELRTDGLIEIESPISRRIKKTELKLIWEVKNTARPHLAAPRATQAPLAGRPSGSAGGSLKLLMERNVANIPSLAPQFERELTNRDWGHLTIYPSPTNVDITEEFYTNAKALGGEDETYFSYVRGKRVVFDADTINCFLGIDWEGEQCQFATSMLEGVDYEDVERTLWASTLIIGQVIADEIQSCAHGASSKAPLGHPSLITHLCEAVVDEPGHPAPPPQPPRELLRTLTSAFPERQVISQDDFVARVAWPADPAVEAIEASTMDEDAEDEDDEADEEEDSNDE
ncbi:hypothetical protein LR48_Vigan221s002100 [Vigna angularis]|uniref:Putative plant transposon protein domain-containing protein n=1 Tax=Phaseolus angularis TaxID=3914 RepID=A0A0L9T7H8_PHAAN|nr:hypothetical protein LR48_Vigan221s002100 [Vigna angularis]